MKIAKKVHPAPVVSLDEHFATLMSIQNDGTFVYEFLYRSRTVEALRASKSTVRITIRKDLPPAHPDIFKPVRDSGDTRRFVNDILTFEARIKDAKRNGKLDVLATAKSDLTARFSNGMTGAIRASAASAPAVRGGSIPAASFPASPEAILGTKKFFDVVSVGELKQSNVSPPIMHTSVTPSSTPSHANVQAAALDLIYAGVDPSIAGTPKSFSSGPHSSLSGFSNISRPLLLGQSNTISAPLALKSDVLIASLQTNVGVKPRVIDNFEQGALIPVVSEAPIRQVLNRKVMRVPSTVGTDDFYAIFELIDELGIVHESVVKKVLHGLLVRIYSTPRVPPKVGIAPVQFSGKNVIEIRQMDARATRVRILRRKVQRTRVQLLETSYEQVAEIPLRAKDGMLKFTDIVNNASPIMYRCIAIGPGGIVANEFTNAVAVGVPLRTSGRHPRSYAAAITIRATSAGHSISVTGVPPGVAAVAVKRRDLTIHETEFKFLDIRNKIGLVGSGALNLTFVDLKENLKQDHVYEYKCDLYFLDGTIVTSTAEALKQHIPLSVGVASVEVADFQLVRDGASVDVKFKVTSRISDEGLDSVRKTLTKQDKLDLFKDELLAERSRLQKLVAHMITRLDISTGIEESFGTFTGVEFSDTMEGKKAGISRLREGRKYKYVISTLIRDPETMFEQFEKQAVDATTGKKYSYKPLNFRHPVALKRGVIVTPETLRRNHSRDEFAHGELGNVYELDVTIDVVAPRIQDVNVARIDRRTSVLKWKAEGPIEKIDHFLIVKEKLGLSSIVGKMHNISQGKTFEFHDRMTPDDIGEVSYKVVPVLNNFTRGSVAISNPLTVHDKRKISAR